MGPQIVGTTYPARRMHVRSYLPTDGPAVDALLDARLAADGREPLSEHKAMRIGTADALQLVVEIGGMVVAYAIAAHHDAGEGHSAVEIVVTPDESDPTALVAVLGAEVRRLVPFGEVLTLWGWRPYEKAAAGRQRWPEARRLLEMKVPLPVPGEPVPPPECVVIDVFRRGRDEDAWIAANAAAFADHPENGSVDRADLEVRMEQPWFDPDGFLMAWEGRRLLGSCWTKVHPGGVGEIYIIGVIPAAQGRGLGRALLRAGLDDLAHRQGATQGMLYVAGDDHRALALYRRMGFETAFALSEFAIPASNASGPVEDQPKGWRQEGQ